MSEDRKGRLQRLMIRCFGLMGIRREEGKGFLLTRRFSTVLLIAAVVLLLGAGSFVYYSSTPGFCNSCHLMEPYVSSWKNSPHNQVPCTQCHFAPGWQNVLRSKFLAIRYVAATVADVHVTKPKAEVEDASCLREGCHEKRLIEGKVLFKGKFHFDHGLHLGNLRRGKQLRCTSCHSQIVQGSHIKVTESVCFTCHFKGRLHEQTADPIAGCTSCHETPSKPIKVAQGLTFDHKPYINRKVDCWRCHSDTIQGTGEVPRQVCVNCHNEPDKVEKYSDSAFMHDWHVTKRKVECFECHSEIRHGMHVQSVRDRDACGVCHSGGHSAQAQMFAGTGGKGVKDMPSKMFSANVDCIGCHAAGAGGKHPIEIATVKATEQSCVTCHGAAYKKMLSDWKEMLADALTKAKGDVAKASKSCEARPDADPRKVKARELLDLAQYDCEFVEKAHGEHNIDYAIELLNKASSIANEAARLVAEGASPAASEAASQRSTATAP